MKPYHKIALFFALTQLLGLYVGMVLVDGARAIPEIGELSVAPLPSQDDPLNAAIFLGYILFGAVAIILVARFYKGRLLFQLLEFMVITSASSVVFFAIALAAGGMGFLESMGIGMLFGLLLGVAKLVAERLKNAAAIISSAGVGALFGFSLGFLPAALFIILLSLYDYIAVFKTRHMLEMARELSSRQLSFAVTAKSLPARKPMEKKAEYMERASEEGERLDLGTGDLAVPVMISVSAYSLGTNGLLYSAAAAAGSTVALFLLLKFVSKERVFLPALPPICLGGMLALLAVKLIGL